MVYNTIASVDDMLHGHFTTDMYDEMYHAMSNTLNHEHETFGLLVAEHTQLQTPRTLVSEIIKTHHYTMLSCQSLIEACYRYKKHLTGINQKDLS